MTNEKKRITPFPLRLPPDLRKELELSAEENTRSLNAEILYILSNRFGIDPNSKEEEKKRFEKVVIEILDKMEKEGTISYKK